MTGEGERVTRGLAICSDLLRQTGPLADDSSTGPEQAKLKANYEAARAQVSDLQQLLLKQQQERARDQLRLDELSTRIDELAARMDRQQLMSQQVGGGLERLEATLEANSAALWSRIAVLEAQGQRFLMFYGSAPLRLLRKAYRVLHALFKPGAPR